MQYVLQRRGAGHQSVRQRRTAPRAAWQQVCFAKPRSKNPTSGAANPASPGAQGGRSALGSEAHELSDQAERLRTPSPANYACEDA